MNTGVFTGTPDDFSEGFTTFHPDSVLPLGGPGKRERAQETPCSCARMKYRMAGSHHVDVPNLPLVLCHLTCRPRCSGTKLLC